MYKCSIETRLEIGQLYSFWGCTLMLLIDLLRDLLIICIGKPLLTRYFCRFWPGNCIYVISNILPQPDVQAPWYYLLFVCIYLFAASILWALDALCCPNQNRKLLRSAGTGLETGCLLVRKDVLHYQFIVDLEWLACAQSTFGLGFIAIADFWGLILMSFWMALIWVLGVLVNMTSTCAMYSTLL